MLEEFLKVTGMNQDEFVHRSGRRKTSVQRLYERIDHSRKKLKEYREKVDICGDKRNSYSKTDHDTTFMRVNEAGRLVCPNNKEFLFLRTEPVKGNQYGRTVVLHQCEDCSGCPHRSQCHKSRFDRIIRLNYELSSFHKEVLDNLNSIHGALLRMNRSIQSEGTYGEMKANRGYERFRRRGINKVILEIALISCGFNLHKYHLSKLAKANPAKSAG